MRVHGINVPETTYRPREPAELKHELDRTGWVCQDDGTEWPCDVWKSRMLAMCTPVTLSLTMVSYLQQACIELPHEPAGLLYLRFLGWIRASEFRSFEGMPPIGPFPLG